MQFKRSSQVAETMKREVSDIIANSLKDPRLGFITVTGVELTDDLRYAKVFVSVYGDEAKQQETLEGLKSGHGYIRREIGKRMRLRYCPDFEFRIDHSVAYGDRIDRLLNQLPHPQEDEKDGHGAQ